MRLPSIIKTGGIILIFTLSIFPSCKSDVPADNVNNQQLMELRDEVAQLKLEKEMKDSIINESLAFFNEIQSNLESIGFKKDEIRIKSADPELTSDDKAWILEQIRHINFLRTENAKKVKELSSQLDKNNLRIKELEAMIEKLVQDIQAKDDQISTLQAELDNMDKEYSKLFDAYQEKEFMVDQLVDQINTAYYSYGTASELEKNQVIERRNGFIGIGKRITLLDDFNEKYFAKIDMTKDKEIFIEGQNLKVITDHSSKSYAVVAVGVNSKIKIHDPREFWKISKYLVVIVE